MRNDEQRRKRLALMVIGLGLVLLSAAFLPPMGCTNRGYFKARSEILTEARQNGVKLPSVKEDQERLAQDQMQQKRLLALIHKRSRGEFRDRNYRLGGGDELEINVFDVPELDVTIRIRQSGFISLPLIGSIKAEGLTERELNEELQAKLRRFVKDPEVSIFISQYGSQKVAVLGAVKNPGTYSLKKGSNSLLELLSDAGGLTDKAGNFLNLVPFELSGLTAANEVEARARLALASFDDTSVENKAIEIYLDQVLGTRGGIPLEIPVRGGDLIIVPEAGTVTVDGEVLKAGSYELGRRMTLLGALAAAGGITYSAKVDEVGVVRDLGMEDKTRLVLNLEMVASGQEKDVRLRNGDIVRVPTHGSRRLTQDTFDGLSKIINFGIGGTVEMVP